jgi:hypothetical protein
VAKHVLKNAVTVINDGTDKDISDHVSSVTSETSRPEVDVTAMGNSHQQFAPGIGDATVTLEVFQDYAVSSIDAILYPLADSETPFLVKIKPTVGAISATNPEFQMTGLLYEYSPLSGSVGDANTTTVTIRNASTGIVKDTTP